MTTTFTVGCDFPIGPAAVMSVIAERQTAQARAELDPDTGAAVTRHTVTGPADAPTAVHTELSGRVPTHWLGGRIGNPPFTRQENWQAGGDGYQGTLTTVVSGLPVTCTAELALRPVDPGSELTAEVTITVSVPILGASIERRVADQVSAAMRSELDHLRTRCRA